MKNENKYYIEFALWTVILLFITGGITQTFFSEMGLSPSQISFISSLINIAQIFIMIFNVFVSDMIKNLKKTIAFLKSSPILFFAMLLPFCFIKSINTNIFFCCAIFASCIFNLFLGFYNVLSYRFVYQITDIKNYATLTNVSTIISSIITVLLSAVITYLSARFPFRYIATTFFILSIVFSLITSLTVNSMKIISDDSKNQQPDKFDFSILLKREFTYFYLPNFLRGCANGIITVMSVICIKNITDAPAVLSSLVTVYYFASILASFLYQFMVKKIKTATIYVLSSILLFIVLPFSLLGKSLPIFIILYAISIIFYIIVSSSNPVYFSEIIDYKEIGRYTSVRLIIMTLGQAVASFFVSFAIDRISSVFILIVAGTCQLISGIMLYLYKPKK